VRECPSCRLDTPEEARFCPNCGCALAGGPASVGVRKVVTIVFSDLCDSTALAERLDTETFRSVIATYYRSMSAVIERHQGVVDKFVGDAFMAVFGVPAVREDDALRAVRAAAGMRRSLVELNEELDGRFAVTLEAHTGVNTGEVIAGHRSRRHGFVSGDTVNVAARLEQAAAPGEILIGEQTLELVRDAVAVEPLPPLELKGKAQRVPAFRLVDADVATDSTGPGFSAPLVGRDHELQQLHAAFGRALDRRGCELITIVGPAGIGKSRLAREFAEAVRERATVAVGRCLSYGEGLTFWPLREVVTALVGSADGENSPDVQAGLLRLLEGGDEPAVVVERVAGAVGWSESAADPPGTFWAVRELLAAAAAERPLVMVLEDIHWAEPIFLDLIDHLAETLDGVPVLLVALARGDLLEVRPRFGGGAPRLSLQALSGDDSKRLVEHLLADDAVDADLAEHVFARAEGNPLFVAELVRMLVEDGRLERSDAGLSAVRSSLLALPPTIHALLAARMDRLEPAERAAVEAGAVIGRSFGGAALLELIDGASRATLDAHLDTLVRKQLIEADGGRLAGEPTFSFSHVLIRDVAYQGMLKSDRANLHARYADWVERAAGERAGEHDEVLGYHLERAHRYLFELGTLDERGRELGARAARRLGSSGSRALARGDTRAAVSLLERAILLLGADDPARRELTIKLSIALAEAGQLTRVDALLRERVQTDRSQGAVVVLHDQTGRQRVLHVGQRLSIGRLPDNDVALVWDDEVSRHHAHIMRMASDWVLVDDSSRNGCYLNGERVTDQSALHDGDVLRFGDTVVLFRAPADGAAPLHSEESSDLPRPTTQG
jgi:class 3 adenylate cyclase